MKRMLILVAGLTLVTLISGCGCHNYTCTTNCPCVYTASCCGSNGWY